MGKVFSHILTCLLVSIGLAALFAVTTLCSGCRYRCYLDPVENFTWEARTDIIATSPEDFAGELHYTFLYQDAEMQGIVSETGMVEGSLWAIRHYQEVGGVFNPDDSNRNWVVWMSVMDLEDPLWNDICRNRPGGCSCSFGALFPQTLASDENQMAISGYYLPWMPTPITTCHETMHILLNHHTGNPDNEHISPLFASCEVLE